MQHPADERQAQGRSSSPRHNGFQSSAAATSTVNSKQVWHHCAFPCYHHKPLQHASYACWCRASLQGSVTEG